VSFNPDADDVLGLEWFAQRSRAAQIDSATNAVAATFESTATENIEFFRIFLSSVVGNGVWEFEVYDAADADPGATAVSLHYPDEDVRIVYARNESNVDVTGTLYQVLDEGEPVDEGNFVMFFAGNILYPYFGLYGARFTGLDGPFAGTPIEQVKLSMWARSFSGVPGFAPVLNANFYTQIADGPVKIGPKLALTTDWQRFEYELTFDPSTGASWKPSALGFLDNGPGVGSSAGFFAASTGSVNFTQQIAEMHIEVTSGSTEKRLAVGRLTNPVVGWNQVQLLDLNDGVAPWNKNSGNSYIILLRRRSGNGRISWSGVDAAPDFCPNASWASFKPGFNSDGQLGPGGIPSSQDSTAYAITLVNDDPAVSVDSQPYAQLRQGLAQGSSESEVRQYFTTGAGGDYGAVSVLIRAVAGPPNDEPLVVDIRLAADDSVLTSQSFEQSAILAPPVTSFQIAQFSLGPIPLSGGTQYYLAFSAAPNTVVSGYEIMILTTADDYSATDEGSGGEDITYGGATDSSWITAQGTQDVNADLAATIALIPDTPANFTATLGTYPAQNFEAPCSIDQITSVDLLWETVADVSYEIQWLDPESIWRTIAILDDPDTNAFEDVQAPLGLEAHYRIRAFTRFAASEWSPEALVTIPSDLSFAGVILTSNQARNYTVAYSYIQQEDGVERDFHFPNGESAIVARLYGRDAQVVFDELEDRKTVFPLTLLISGAATAPLPLPGPRVFDAALRICRAPIDSVVVKDKDGNVFYANVLPTDARRREKGSTYELDVTVTEVSTVPPIATSGTIAD
jgi:hypothetical protein